MLWLKRAAEDLVYIARRLIAAFSEHRLAQVGGELAYFALLSFLPFLVLITGMLSGLGISADELASYVALLFPRELYDTIESYVEVILRDYSATAMSVSAIVSVYSASKVIKSLGDAFDLAYGVKRRRGFIRRTGTYMLGTLVLALAFIVIFSLALVTRDVISALTAGAAPWAASFLSVLRTVLLTVTLFSALTALYAKLPSVRLCFLSALPGAAAACLMLAVLSMLFSLYIKYFLRSSVLLGGFGMVIALLLYMYFCGIILVFCCEFNSIIIKTRKNR